MEQQAGSQANTSLPEITQESDVYTIGSLAAIKAIHDKANPFFPYYLNVFPHTKAEITSFIDEVAPLSRVTAANVTHDFNGDMEDMYVQFMQKSFKKLVKIAPD